MSFQFASLTDYSAIIDVRSPAEYAIDHIPGAVNLPVLDDNQRHEVGKLYKEDPFAGRKLGMACVAGNLAKMATGPLHDQQACWRPLVYCWRGGMRSNSVVTTLRQVGWQADAIPGGYKAYRAYVRTCLDTLPGLFSWRVLCGPTGAGKTLLLAELARQGTQVLDLEELANHRGSLFGHCGPQPSQRGFESALIHRFKELDRSTPVFVEAESKVIGKLRLPDALLACMRAGSVVSVVAPLMARARLTARDYARYADAQEFATVTAKLVRYVGGHQVQLWHELHSAGQYVELAASILEQHYDPRYFRSLAKNYGTDTAAIEVTVVPDDLASLVQTAQALVG